MAGQVTYIEYLTIHPQYYNFSPDKLNRGACMPEQGDLFVVRDEERAQFERLGNLFLQMSRGDAGLTRWGAIEEVLIRMEAAEERLLDIARRTPWNEPSDPSFANDPDRNASHPMNLAQSLINGT
jgi:hypothetical protein